MSLLKTQTTNSINWQGQQALQAQRKRAADSIVNRYTGLATAAGFIPVPLMDQAAMVGLQLSLIARLSDLYGVPFSREAGRNVLLSLICGSIPHAGGLAVASYLKAVPGPGSLAALVTAPALGGSITYALGRVLVRHYESGGTLFDLDTAAAREYFRSLLSRKEGSDSGPIEMMPDEETVDSKSSQVAPDDLQRINGIGPVFAERLNQLGIRTFSDLATADRSRLVQSIPGLDPDIHDIDSWQEQAARLADGEPE